MKGFKQELPNYQEITPGGATLIAVKNEQQKPSNVIYDSYNKIDYYCPSLGFDKNHNELPLISLFTGGGGLDLGLEWAGFSTKAFVEKDKYCIQTLYKNRPNWPLVGNGDITKISAKDILKTAGLKRGEVALLAGGAPCQPFSSLGKNEGEEIPNGQLYRYFIDMVDKIKPAAFLFENVRGMASNHSSIIRFMQKEFSNSGYSLSIALLCAANYGVPQRRNRVFIIGRRDKEKPGFPVPTHAGKPDQYFSHLQNLFLENGVPFPYPELHYWRTVQDAFYGLSPAHFLREDAYEAKLAPKIRRMISYIKPGTNMYWKDLPDDLKFDCWKRGKFQGTDNFSRLHYGEPSVTIRTGAIYPAKGRYIHPEFDRALNTIEMASLQTFPICLDQDYGWYFCGGITPVARQIGNAVPPLLAKAIGISLRDQIYEVIQSKRGRKKRATN